MKSVSYTTTHSFSASHKLYQPLWSEERNVEVFGKCANEHWHGHNFELQTTVRGDVTTQGVTIGRTLLDRIVQEEVINLVDFKNLNDDVSFLKGLMPTCEVLADEFWKRIQTRLQAEGQARLYRLILKETRNNSVEYFGS